MPAFNFAPPWQDAGRVKTRTAGVRRVWLLAPEDKARVPGLAPPETWTAVISGEGSTCGATREEALANAAKW